MPGSRTRLNRPILSTTQACRGGPTAPSLTAARPLHMAHCTIHMARPLSHSTRFYRSVTPHGPTVQSLITIRPFSHSSPSDRLLTQHGPTAQSLSTAGPFSPLTRPDRSVAHHSPTAQPLTTARLHTQSGTDHRPTAHNTPDTPESDIPSGMILISTYRRFLQDPLAELGCQLWGGEGEVFSTSYPLLTFKIFKLMAGERLMVSIPHIEFHFAKPVYF